MTKVSKRYFSFSRVWERGAPRASPLGDGSPSDRLGAAGRPGGLQNLVDGGEAVADLVDLLFGMGPVRVVRDLPDARGRRDRVGAVPVVLGAGPGPREVSGVGAAVVVVLPGVGGGRVAVARAEGRVGADAESRQGRRLRPGHRLGRGAGAVVHADGELDRPADVAGEGVDDRVAQGPFDGLLGELARCGEQGGVVQEAEGAGHADPGPLLGGEGGALGGARGELGDDAVPGAVEIGELVRHCRPPPSSPCAPRNPRDPCTSHHGHAQIHRVVHNCARRPHVSAARAPPPGTAPSIPRRVVLRAHVPRRHRHREPAMSERTTSPTVPAPRRFRSTAPARGRPPGTSIRQHRDEASAGKRDANKAPCRATSSRRPDPGRPTTDDSILHPAPEIIVPGA